MYNRYDKVEINSNGDVSSCETSQWIFFATVSILTSNVSHNSLIETYNATCRYRRLRWLTRPTFSPPYIAEETSLVLRLESFSLWKFLILFLIAGCVTLLEAQTRRNTKWFLNERNSIVNSFVVKFVTCISCE